MWKIILKKPIQLKICLLSPLIVLAQPILATTILVESLYPEAAIENCIEGDVTVKYKVSENHTVIDIKIVKSKPSGIFDESTIKSLKRYCDTDDDGTIKEITISWRLEDCKI